MDFAQERITTLHDLTGHVPAAPTGESVVVVPMAGDSVDEVTPDHVLTALSTVRPRRVVIPLRSPRSVATSVRSWADEYDVPVTVLWCDAPALEETLAEHGLDGRAGKGRDVWLGLGVAASRGEYVAVHDADATTYSEAIVPRLLSPLTADHDFVKGYYARVEQNRLYGRLVRLFVAPLMRALGDRHDAEILQFLSAFRYPLAGEIALTAGAARQLRTPPSWGLEIGTLAEAFRIAGTERSAQVDLGVYRHDHRPVSGRDGLLAMSDRVGGTLFRALEEHGVDVDYDGLAAAYTDAGTRLVEAYAADAAFNGLEYDADAERDQMQQYAASLTPPSGDDERLPAWTETDLTPTAVLEAARVSGN